MHSVSITTKLVSSKSSNRVHGEVYSIQLCVIKFVSATDWWFSPVLWFPPPIKLTTNDITEILLKVTLSTINQTNLDLMSYDQYFMMRTRIQTKNLVGK